MIKLNYKRFASGEFEFGTHNSSSGTYLQGKIVWSSTSNGTDANSSNVTADIYVKKNVTYATTGRDWRVSITINGDTYSVSTLSDYKTVGTDYVYMMSYTVNNVAHNNDGSKTISIGGRVQGPTGTSIASLYTEGSADCTLDTIPRYFSGAIGLWLIDATETSYTYGWSTTENCGWVRYHFDGSAGWHDVFSGSATSGSFTVYNGDSIYGNSTGTVSITANSTHSVYVDCMRADSGLWSTSSTVSNTSYDYPKPTYVSNSLIGDVFTVSVYNPKGRTYSLQLISNENGSGIGSYSGAINGDIVGFNDSGAISAMYASIPSKSSGTYYAQVTYDGNVRTSGNGTYSVKGTEGPNFSTDNWSYTSNLTDLTNNNQVVIGGYSNVTFTVNTAATSNYSATGFKYSMVWGDETKAITALGSATISGKSSNILKVIATDDRGLSSSDASGTRQLVSGTTYIPYSVPTISSISTSRQNGIDAATELNMKGTFYATNFGGSGVTNTLYSAKYYTKESTSDTWSSAYTIDTSNFTIDTTNGTFSLSDFLIHADGASGGFTVGTRYDVKVEISDANGLLGSKSITTQVTDGKIARDVYQDSDGNYHQGINGRADSNYTEKINGTLNVTSDVSTSGAYQHSGTNILRNNGTSTILSSKNNTMYFRPEGDTDGTHQATLDTYGLLTTASEKTGSLVTTTENSSLNAGKWNTSAGTCKIFRDGIGWVGGTNTSGNDSGWIKFEEATTNSGSLEISTGDDGTEPIYVKQYNTNSAVVHSMTLLDASGNTSVPNNISVGGYITLNNHYDFQKPVFTRLLFYGDHFFQKDQWNTITYQYSFIDNNGGEPSVKEGHTRWYRMVVRTNDNVTSGTGLAIGVFNQSGGYVTGFSFNLTWGSGADEWGNWKASNALTWSTLNIGWTYLKSIIPGGSSGTQGYLFCVELVAFDVPTGIDPNNYDY